MGSRFVASKDAKFRENCKKVIPPSKANDILVHPAGLVTIKARKDKFSVA